MFLTRRKIQTGVLLACLAGALAWLGYRWSAYAQGAAMNSRVVSATPWLPKKTDAVYVGPQICIECHKGKGMVSQLTTSMSRALEPAPTSEILSKHARMTFTSGPYSYQIVRQGNQSIYSVTDGKNTISVPLLYSFGQGKAGQTYVYQYQGSFYESRLSYFREIDGLDWTIGYPRDVPPALEVAAGRAISLDEARSCFTCHGTGAAYGTQLHLDRLIPGITCEACHGPGGEHVAIARAKKPAEKTIFNPGAMEPDDLTQNFCGSCHRSAEQVASNKGLHGITSVRFQPYRLFTSRGHDPFDARLSCTACHDSHGHPFADEAAYDTKCFACHRSGASAQNASLAQAEESVGRTAKPCTVSQKGCVNCHMPKIHIEGAHFNFTDHRIRVARPGEPFPN